LKITLLADEDKNLANLFGVWRLKKELRKGVYGDCEEVQLKFLLMEKLPIGDM